MTSDSDITTLLHAVARAKLAGKMLNKLPRLQNPQTTLFLVERGILKLAYDPAGQKPSFLTRLLHPRHKIYNAVQFTDEGYQRYLERKL